MTAPEERGDPRLVQEIRRLVTAGDRKAILEYIKGVPPDELAEAMTWFAKSGRSLLRDDADGRIHYRIQLSDFYSRSTVRDLVTVAVNAPSKAARFLPWRSLASSRSVEVLVLVDALASKGEDWCRSFVAAAITRNATAGRETAAAVIRHCLPLILRFKLPTADLNAYPRLWALYYGLLSGRVHSVWDDDIAATYPYPSWGALQFRIDPSGRCEILPRMQKHLLELFDLDATAPEALMGCFDIPDALAPLKGGGVGSTICGYIQRGTVSRAYVLERVVTALSRCDGIPNQRVLAEVLAALKPEPDEASRIIPLLISTVATSAGFLSCMALELLLTSTLTSGDLQDLSVAVFGRSEKKPQDLLVRHLKSLRTSGTYDDGVLAACWEAAAGSSDLKIRTTATEMAGRPLASIREESLSATSLWGTGVRQPPQIPPYVALEVDSKKPLPWWSREGEDSISEEQYVDCFLRTVYDVPQFVRDRYRQRNARRVEQFPDSAEPSTSWRRWADPSPEVVLTMWASGEHNLAAHRNLTGLLRASLSRPVDRDDPFHASSPLAAVRTFRQSELVVQAGTVPYSLATPSYDNFRVELGRLVALLRLFERQGWAYGEADLFQALLRLGPLDAQLAAGVPELPVRPLDGSGGQERLAGRILRDWVGGGGFKPPQVDSPLILPVPLERFPSIPRELLSSELWGGSGRRFPRSWTGCQASAVVPFWPDLGAMWLERGLAYGGLVVLRAGGLAGATAGEVGQLTHDWFIRELASSRRDDRNHVVETVLELAARRQLSADHLARAARKRVEAGDQSLGRLVRSLELVAYEGHLDCVWPVLTALVVASSEQQRLPAGTPELLATCTEFWESIPADHRPTAIVPGEFAAAVRNMAVSKSATKAGLEAKRLASRMGLVP